MAGFVMRQSTKKSTLCFHIDDQDVRGAILKAADNPRVITLQLDCDELEAALWGLENYDKQVIQPQLWVDEPQPQHIADGH